MDKDKVNLLELLKKLSVQNENTVEFFVKNMLDTDDQYLRDQIGFFLTDHFKTESIEKALVELIKDKRWKKRNGTLLFLLSEYTNNSKYLCFLIDLLLKKENRSDGEIFMNAYSMIINLHPPLDRKEITKALQKLNREDKKNTRDEERRHLIKSLKNYLLGQREIAKYYDQFTKRI